MKITVFTSSYNHGKYVGDSIQSVLNQTYTDFEYLVYDDGSTDNTWEVIQKYSSIDKRIKAFKLPKMKNIAQVVNISLKEYKGDYWVWCPGDDMLKPEALEECIKYAKIYPNTVFYNDWIFIDKEGREYGKGSFTATPEEFNKEVWKSSPICMVGIWIPRTAFDIVGGFPEHQDFSEDFYWMIKSTIDGIEWRHIDKYLHYRRNTGDGNSITQRNIHKILDNVPLIRKELMEYKLRKT